MTQPKKILLVKTSSLGDVIHNLPVVGDIRGEFPGAVIDWAVEEAFADIPALHPGVRQVIPVAVRRWRRGLLDVGTWREIAAALRRLRAEPYDFVLDTQGLIKSAAIARLARGRRCGYGWASAREPAASLFYGATRPVQKDLHAVTRNRLLAARCLGYEVPERLDYGIRPPASAASGWLPASPYVVLLHATSREEKLWPEPSWVALGGSLARRGWRCVLPWGGSGEAVRSRRLAGLIADAVVPPRLSLKELAALLAGARAAVGVDTGLTHLTAALRVPVVGIYCATDPGLTGIFPVAKAKNLGGRTGAPAPEAVAAALEEVTES